MYELNDDMDNLFRKAAEDYPLKITGARWEAIAPQISVHKHMVNVWPYIRSAVLLFLLALPYLCADYTLPFSHNKKSDTEKKISATANHHPELVQQNQRSVAERAVVGRTTHPSMHNGRLKKQPPSAKESLHPAISTADTGPIEDVSDPAIVTTGEHFSENRVSAVLEKPVGESPVPDSLNKEGPVTQSDLQDSHAAPEQKSKMRNKVFYVALSGGMDVTTVKMQRFDRAGTSAGILVGYQFANRFAIEAAVLSSKKYYYTKGSYFNSSKLNLSPTTKMIKLTGNCSMLEVPVVLKYTIQPGDRHAWIATAGVSNLIMDTENYDYVYLYTTSGREATYNRTYKNSAREWLSMLQFSAGHELRVRSGYFLRSEPYIQIPIKGVGFGDLPMTSFGFRLAAGRSF